MNFSTFLIKQWSLFSKIQSNLQRYVNKFWIISGITSPSRVWSLYYLQTFRRWSIPQTYRCISLPEYYFNWHASAFPFLSRNVFVAHCIRRYRFHSFSRSNYRFEPATWSQKYNKFLLCYKRFPWLFYEVKWSRIWDMKDDWAQIL